MDIQTVISKELFSFINFMFVTQKWENKSNLKWNFLSFNLELATRSKKIKV